MTRRHAWRRFRLPLRRQRRRPLRHRASAQGPRAEHHRDLQRARGDARRTASSASRFSSTGSVYGEADGLPDAGRRAVPRADVALRRVEAGRRGADRGLLRAASASGLHLPLRLDPRRALHARPRLRLLQEPAPRSDAAARARQRQAAQVLPLRPGLPRRDPDVALAADDDRRATSSTWAPTSTAR